MSLDLVLQARDPLESLDRCSVQMMLFLIADVVYHPIQVLRPETDYAIAVLPFQESSVYQFAINVKGTGLFDPVNPFGDLHVWWDRNGDVDMSFDATDVVKNESFGLEGVAPDVAIQTWFDLGADQRQTLLHMPRDMEVDF